MSEAARDQNHVPGALGQSSTSSTTTLPLKVDSITGRLLVDSASGSGTVTDVSVVTANGFAGSVATSTTTPAITLSTTITGILQGNGTAISAITVGSGLNFAGGTLAATTPTAITVANEATDTTCFVAFFTAASGDLGPKTNVNMTFNSNTGVVTFASSVLTTTDINGGTIDGAVIGGASAAAITGTTIIGNSFVPNSSTIPSNGIYLPAANTLGWAINSAAEVQLTATSLSPAVDGGNSLGTTALGWQNLFGNTGFVINIENSDWVATHTAGILTVGTGDLRVTTAGTNSASVVTVGGTQTLTSKTLTSPTITTASLSGTQTLAENASIALDPAGSADGKYTGITIAGTAGATLAFGDLVYLAVADSRWELADADAATTSDRMLGMCVLAAAADGDPTVLLLIGQIRADAKFPALTVGAAAYVGETAGAIQVAIPTGADNVIRRVGYALTADEIYFNPSMDAQTTVA